MNKYRQSRENPKCLWCGKSGDGDYKEIEFKEAITNAPVEPVLVCNDECEKALIETEKTFKGKLKNFIIGLVVGMMLFMTGAVLAAVNERLLAVMGSGLVVLGVTFFFYPFVTPQTVGMMGMKKGFLVGRAAGALFVVGGVVLSVVMLTQ